MGCSGSKGTISPEPSASQPAETPVKVLKTIAEDVAEDAPEPKAMPKLGGAGKWAVVRARVEEEATKTDEELAKSAEASGTAPRQRLFVQKREPVNIPKLFEKAAFLIRKAAYESGKVVVKRPPGQKMPVEEMDQELWYVCDRCEKPIAEEKGFFECPTCSKLDDDGEYIVCRFCYITNKHRHQCIQKIVPVGCGPPLDKLWMFEPGDVVQKLTKKERSQKRDEAELRELNRLIEVNEHKGVSADEPVQRRLLKARKIHVRNMRAKYGAGTTADQTEITSVVADNVTVSLNVGKAANKWKKKKPPSSAEPSVEASGEA